MKLDQLLNENREAAKLFQSLPLPARQSIRKNGEDIHTLEDLYSFTTHLVSHEGPFYAVRTEDGTMLEPEEKAEWTKYHQT